MHTFTAKKNFNIIRRSQPMWRRIHFLLFSTNKTEIEWANMLHQGLTGYCAWYSMRSSFWKLLRKRISNRFWSRLIRPNGVVDKLSCSLTEFLSDLVRIQVFEPTFLKRNAVRNISLNALNGRNNEIDEIWILLT